MKKMICLVLVLAFCLSLAMPVFAARTPSAADSGTPAKTPSGSNPKTGDMIMLWVAIMLVALMALAAVVICYRKFAR